MTKEHKGFIISIKNITHCDRRNQIYVIMSKTLVHREPACITVTTTKTNAIAFPIAININTTIAIVFNIII